MLTCYMKIVVISCFIEVYFHKFSGKMQPVKRERSNIVCAYREKFVT